MSDGNVAEGNSGGLPRARPRGRPRGSRNRPNREQFAPTSVVLTVPPGVELTNWLIGYSTSNNVCINVLRGFGRISQVDLIHLNSEGPGRFSRCRELLNLISISGACFSPISIPSIFNAMLCRGNGDVIYGTVLFMTTIDYVVLNAVLYRNPLFIEAPFASVL